MKKVQVRKLVALSFVACLLVPGVQVAQAAWEGDSGVAWVPVAYQKAWAWAKVSGGNSGRAIARVGTASSDTGWFMSDRRQAEATERIGSSPVIHEFYVK